VAVDNVLEKAEEIKNLCDQYGLEIAALATYLQCGEVGKIDQVLQAASVMACPRIRVNVPVYDGSENYNDVFAKTVSEIRVLEKLAKKYNVKINFEIHHKRIIPSVSAAYRLVSDFDSRYIGVIHDAGNMVHEGYEQYKMGLEILGTYLDHVHIKNARWINEDMPAESDYRWKAEWCPLKKGQVNFKVLLDALKAVGYDGYLSFEDFSNEVSTDEKLEGNIAFIKSIL
jgi:sugar phosphate isomerase/epimerase